MAFRTNKTPVLQTKSASGAVATFNTALAMPLVSCNIAVNAWQEGSGDPSPDNVRPIHGFSEVNLTANNVIHTIQLGQEVYGAEVDVVNGVAHVGWIKKVIDETSGVTRASNGILYLDNFFDIPEDTMSVKCNCYTRGSNRSTVLDVMYNNLNYSFCCKTGGTTQTRVMIKDTRFNTLEAYNEWVALNPISVLIMLAEPFDIQLTPTQIETLIGNNTIFADTGDTSLTYKDLDIAKRGNFREVFRLPS